MWYDGQVQIVSWNLNSIRSRAALVEALLTQETPDVLAMQETRCADATFPWAMFEHAGYEVAHLGTGGHAGVALASRVGLERVSYGFGGEHGPPFDQPRLIAADCDGLRVASVYAPNGQRIRSAAWFAKLAWFQLLAVEMGLELEATRDLLVIGDFNVCPAPIDVYDPIRKRDRNLVSSEERAAVAALLDLGLHDLARELDENEPGFTWFSFAAGQLEANRGYRLDLALGSRTVRERSTECRPLLRWREPDLRPSDHAPLSLVLG